MRSRSIIGLQAVVGAVALVLPLASAQRVTDLPPPIAVTVEQPSAHGTTRTVHYVAPSSTLGGVIAAYGLLAKSGSFLDVSGTPLKPNAYPGRIELDGREAPPTTGLRDGDVVTVVDGHDVTEPKVTEVVPIPGGHISDPQFYLGTTPGHQILVEGKLSGKLVSSTFQATGPTVTPKAVALTFDDGPNPVYTPKILAVLKKFKVHATFFTIGFEVASYPQLVRAEVSAGMQVGDHTWDHPNSPPFRDFGPARIQSEISLCRTALIGTGAHPHLFRPPGGSYSDVIVTTADQLGLRVVLWSVDPEDWRNDITPNQIVSNVLTHVHAGSIVIMHDGGGFQDATVAALPKIIKGIRKMGLKLVAITA